MKILQVWKRGGGQGVGGVRKWSGKTEEEEGEWGWDTLVKAPPWYPSIHQPHVRTSSLQRKPVNSSCSFLAEWERTRIIGGKSSPPFWNLLALGLFFFFLLKVKKKKKNSEERREEFTCGLIYTQINYCFLLLYILGFYLFVVFGNELKSSSGPPDLRILLKECKCSWSYFFTCFGLSSITKKKRAFQFKESESVPSWESLADCCSLSHSCFTSFACSLTAAALFHTSTAAAFFFFPPAVNHPDFLSYLGF